jgi:hypothetical protein
VKLSFHFISNLQNEFQKTKSNLTFSSQSNAPFQKRPKASIPAKTEAQQMQTSVFIVHQQALKRSLVTGISVDTRTGSPTLETSNAVTKLFLGRDPHWWHRRKRLV